MKYEPPGEVKFEEVDKQLTSGMNLKKQHEVNESTIFLMVLTKLQIDRMGGLIKSIAEDKKTNNIIDI